MVYLIFEYKINVCHNFNYFYRVQNYDTKCKKYRTNIVRIRLSGYLKEV